MIIYYETSEVVAFGQKASGPQKASDDSCEA